jgi:3,4-dihydroxy-2-butanone 4-phosphate synthase
LITRTVAVKERPGRVTPIQSRQQGSQRRGIEHVSHKNIRIAGLYDGVNPAGE